MSKKDYIKLARALKLAKEHEIRANRMWSITGVDTAAKFLALALEEDNSRFDSKKFLDAAK